MIEQSNLHQEFRERSSSKFVVIGFGDPSDPTVGRAIGRDVEFETLRRQSESLVRNEIKGQDSTYLENNAFSLQDLFSSITLFSHEYEFIHTLARCFKSAAPPRDPRRALRTHLGAMISSYLAATNIAVTPTSWNFPRLTTRFDMNRSMILTVIQRVSGSMW